MALSSNWLGHHPLKVKTPVRIRIALQNIASWCNGNTGDFDSLIPGSSPGEATLTRLSFYQRVVRVKGEMRW